MEAYELCVCVFAELASSWNVREVPYICSRRLLGRLQPKAIALTCPLSNIRTHEWPTEREYYVCLELFNSHPVCLSPFGPKKFVGKPVVGSEDPSNLPSTPIFWNTIYLIFSLFLPSQLICKRTFAINGILILWLNSILNIQIKLSIIRKFALIIDGYHLHVLCFGYVSFIFAIQFRQYNI